MILRAVLSHSNSPTHSIISLNLTHSLTNNSSQKPPPTHFGSEIGLAGSDSDDDVLS